MLPLSMTLNDLWPRFRGHDIFWSRISWKGCICKTKLLLHNRKLYLIYGMVNVFVDWPLNTSRRLSASAELLVNQKLSWCWQTCATKNVVTLKSGSEVTQGHWKWYCSINWVWFPISALSNFFPKMNRFWDIRLRIMSWPWNLGQRSLKVIGTDTYRSVTYDLLFTFHSKHGPISQR